MVSFEAGSQDQEDEELSSEGNANANKEDGEFGAAERRDKSTAALLSEEELVDLLKKEAAEEEVEERELEEEGVEADKGKVDSGEAEEAEGEEKLEDNLDLEEDGKEEIDEAKVKDARVEDDVKEEATRMSHKDKKEGKMADREEQVTLLEETDGSAELDIPVDLDYAADSGVIQPLQVISAKIKPHTDDTQPEKELPTIDEDYEQDTQNTEAVDMEEASDPDQKQRGKNDKDSRAKSKETDQDVTPQEPKSSRELESESRVAGKEDERSKNDSASHTKGKTRKQKKNQRARKHLPQSEETPSGQELSQQDPQEPESSSSDNTVHKAKRRRAGKWVNDIICTRKSCYGLSVSHSVVM